MAKKTKPSNYQGKRKRCEAPGCRKASVGGFYCLDHYPKEERKVRVPINKRFDGKPALRVKFWRTWTGKEYANTLEVETSTSQDISDFLIYLFCNKSLITDELLDRVIAEVKQARADHEFHHP